MGLYAATSIGVGVMIGPEFFRFLGQLKPWIVQTSLLTRIIFFGVLRYYEFLNSGLTLG